MSEQSTPGNPGAGAVGSMQTLERQLRSLESSLDSGLAELEKADDVFLDNWIGCSAVLARAQLAALVKQTKLHGEVIATVKKALGVYSDEVAEIKRLAAVHIQTRDAGMRDLFSRPSYGGVQSEPSESGLQYEQDSASEQTLLDATARLRELAVRRKEADRALLVKVRAVLVETWA